MIIKLIVHIVLSGGQLQPGALPGQFPYVEALKLEVRKNPGSSRSLDIILERTELYAEITLDTEGLIQF